MPRGAKPAGGTQANFKRGYETVDIEGVSRDSVAESDDAGPSVYAGPSEVKSMAPGPATRSSRQITL
jgi:hypothetical protein